VSVALVVVVLMCATTGLALVAKRIDVPFPVAFVLGGAALAFIPHLPPVHLDPNWIFLLVLPPLLFSGGWSTDYAEFKRNRRAIGLLAIGLVVFTTVIVAAVAHALLPALTWPLAFVLGAVVAPPDAVAAEAILQKLAVPRRIAAILSGESLVNDATALVFYRFAIAAVAYGTFSFAQAGLAFVVVSIGGIAVGLAIAFGFELVMKFLSRKRLDDPTISNAILLIAPFASYLPAEAMHVSGVLAAVTAGMYLGRRSAHFWDSETRLIGGAVWEVMLFLLNGFVFVVIGLQLPQIVSGLSNAPWHYITAAVVVSLVVILIRPVWIFPATYLPRLFSKKLRDADPSPDWRAVVVVSWAGMRGIVSLAAALAIPLVGAGHADLGEARNEILFVTFCVIFATLIVQGFTLAPMINALGVAESSSRVKAETEVRIRALEAGIEELHAQERHFDSALEWETVGRLLGEYAQRIEHLRGHLSAEDGEEEPVENTIDHRLQKAALDAERTKIKELRADGKIPDDVFRNIQYDLDLADVRLT
jgi:CPA1 family monovalent cation:H+ antiporter